MAGSPLPEMSYSPKTQRSSSGHAKDDSSINSLPQLPSPFLSPLKTAHLSKKRKREASVGKSSSCDSHKRVCLSAPEEGPEDVEPISTFHDCIKYWVIFTEWPPEFADMAEERAEAPKKPTTPTTLSSHRATVVRILAENGVFARHAELKDRVIDKALLDTLQEESRDSVAYSAFPPEMFATMADNVQFRNEARVRHDLGGWIAPSPSMLALHGIEGMDILGEELDCMWTRCAVMGHTRPKPEFVVGLSPEAFTTGELKKILNYTSMDRPSFVSPYLSYPFLVCEMKSFGSALGKADMQNLHSAAIAVRMLFTLYESAYGSGAEEISRDLDGRLLVFSVSHDYDHVSLWGHYAVGVDAATRKYFRYSIAVSSMIAGGGQQRLKPYNFVRNLYEVYAPMHLLRIKNALSRFPEVVDCGRSFVTADLHTKGLSLWAETSSGEAASDESPTEEVTSDEVPSSSDKPAKKRARTTGNGKRAASQPRKLISDLMKQLDDQAASSKQREELLAEQLKQLRADTERREQQLREDTERREQQQRAEAERREKQQRAEAERREQQMQEQIRLLQQLVGSLQKP